MPGFSQVLTQEELDTQRALWNSHDFVNYDVEIQSECFCLPIHLRPGLVRVRSGVIESVTDSETLELLDPANFLTIDELFDELQSVVDDTSIAEAEASFDETFGYPTELLIDFFPGAVDDEIRYWISEFVPIDAQFLAADYSGDGEVDGQDLFWWELLYAIPMEPRPFDVDFDADTDGVDFLGWQQQYGLPSDSGSIAVAAASMQIVPEQASFVILLIGLGVILVGRTSIER